MVTKVTDAKEVVVGKYYLVPCVKLKDTEANKYYYKDLLYVPVLLPYHEDKNIGVDQYHYHHDLRFISTVLFKANQLYVNNNNHLQRLVLNEAIIENETIYWKKKKCLREQLAMPPVLLKQLESLYINAKVTDDICPHKGISLVGCPKRDGKLICPGHGLQWCSRTGKLKTHDD